MEVYDFDLYAALELEPSSSEAEIKRAYRRLALALHPDRNGGVESEAFLQLKNIAWAGHARLTEFYLV